MIGLQEGISGGVLLSRIASHAVPSALKSLTAVFGMGTGVSSPPSPPEKSYIQIKTSLINCAKSFVAKPHDLLVPVSSVRYRTYTPGLSTS